MRYSITIFWLLSCCSLFAQPELQFVDEITGLVAPTDITGSGDGSNRLFIAEQVGRVRIYDPSTETLQNSSQAFLDIQSRVNFNGGERGLLGIAFHPGFATNGYFYVHYSASTATGLALGSTVVSRFTLVGGRNTVDPATEVVLYTLFQPRSNHNAGDLAFGPDGYLYFGLGDSGGGGDPDNDSQNLTTPLGSLLRIDVDSPSGGRNYGIPADNPFLTPGDNIPDEIYAVGLRNPWRISFDRNNGDLYIADVGQGAREEVNRQLAGTAGGQNYGWDCREGKISYSGIQSPNCATNGPFTEPLFDYNRTNSAGGKSITGGFVYRGSASDLGGYYVCADYISANWFLYPAAGGTTLVQNYENIIEEITTFGEDDRAELWVASRMGSVFRVTTTQALPVNLVNWTATAVGKSVNLAWETSSEEDASHYEVTRSMDGNTFTGWRRVAARNAGSQTSTYQLTDDDPLADQSFYRLRQVDLGGRSTNFAVLPVNLAEAGDLRLFPNPARDKLYVQLPRAYSNATVRLRLYDLAGRQVFDQALSTGRELQEVSLSGARLARGSYTAVILADKERYLRKIVLW